MVKIDILVLYSCIRNTASRNTETFTQSLPGRECPMVYDDIGLEPIESVVNDDAPPMQQSATWPCLQISEDIGRLSGLDARLVRIIRLLDR